MILKVLSGLLAVLAVAFGLLAFLVSRGYIALFALTLILWLAVYMIGVNQNPS